MAKGQPGLRDAVQGAFEELLSSSVYATVLSRWGVHDGADDRISVSSGR